MYLYIVVVVRSVCAVLFFFFFKQKTAYEMRISDWSSDVCSSDLHHRPRRHLRRRAVRGRHEPGGRSDRRDGGRAGSQGGAEGRRQGQGWQGVEGHRRPGQGGAQAREGQGCRGRRSEEHMSELQSLMRISYAVFCVKKKTNVALPE